jgi:hypothetical protein
VRFHACPSVRREVEVVAEQIWRAVREASGGDAPLGFHEIAVLLPSDARDEYLPHVEAVFSEAHGIPHCVVDLDLASTSRVADACLALVELPLGRFARPEVLALVTHPNLLANMPEASIDDVRQLVSELGVFYGLDREELAGTYVDEDRLNWEQGLLRVALGELMSDSRRPDDVGLALGDSHYLPVSTDPSWARARSHCCCAGSSPTCASRAAPPDHCESGRSSSRGCGRATWCPGATPSRASCAAASRPRTPWWSATWPGCPCPTGWRPCW